MSAVMIPAGINRKKYLERLQADKRQLDKVLEDTTLTPPERKSVQNALLIVTEQINACINGTAIQSPRPHLGNGYGLKSDEEQDQQDMAVQIPSARFKHVEKVKRATKSESLEDNEVQELLNSIEGFSTCGSSIAKDLKLKLKLFLFWCSEESGEQLNNIRETAQAMMQSDPNLQFRESAKQDEILFRKAQRVVGILQRIQDQKNDSSDRKEHDLKDIKLTVQDFKIFPCYHDFKSKVDWWKKRIKKINRTATFALPQAPVPTQDRASAMLRQFEAASNQRHEFPSTPPVSPATGATVGHAATAFENFLKSMGLSTNSVKNKV